MRSVVLFCVEEEEVIWEKTEVGKRKWGCQRFRGVRS